MTPDDAVLRTREDVTARIAAAVVHGTPTRVGAELEHFAVDLTDPLVRPSLSRVAQALDGLTLPGGSVVTTEPGGQVELSSLPQPSVARLVEALSADLAAAGEALAGTGVALVGQGTDPQRPPVRLVERSRYAVMERHFDQDGPAGRTMMCSTTAVQVSLDAGTDDTHRSPGSHGTQSAHERWQRAHALGPALVAAFACSPLLSGAPTGWASTRQRIWSQVDPTRTAAPAPGVGPVESLSALALGARLMCVLDDEASCHPVPAELTFGNWLAGDWAAAPRPPSTADLDYHLTTLFPPVRLRGWLELRYLDGLPDPLWRVAVATAWALLDDDQAADAARAACTPVEGQWLRAARVAVADPDLRSAAIGCLSAAEAALLRVGAPELAAEVSSFAGRFPERGRCPADDVLEAHRSGHALLGDRLTA